MTPEAWKRSLPEYVVLHPLAGLCPVGPVTHFTGLHRDLAVAGTQFVGHDQDQVRVGNQLDAERPAKDEEI